MKQVFTKVTRKGQITLPAEIRKSLGVRVGDRIALTLVESTEVEDPRVLLQPVRSVAELTFGAVTPRKRPEDFEELRRLYEEGKAAEVLAEAAGDDGASSEDA